MKIISEVRVVPFAKINNGLAGFASFVLYGTIHCESVGIFTRPCGGYRLVYPTRKRTGRDDISIYYPIDASVGKEIERAVISKFEEVVNSDGRYYHFRSRMG